MRTTIAVIILVTALLAVFAAVALSVYIDGNKSEIVADELTDKAKELINEHHP